MRKIWRYLRCLLSRTIFERIKGLPDPNLIAAKIGKKVEKHNFNTRITCDHCNGPHLRSEMSGSEGWFTWPHQFYRCADCGNAQENLGFRHLWQFEELAKIGIVKDAGRYRYVFFGNFLDFLIFLGSVQLACFGSAYATVYLGWSFQESLIFFVPLILYGFDYIASVTDE